MKVVPDLLRDRTAWKLSFGYARWVLLGLVAPGVVGGLATRSWAGAATGVLWGGLVRVFALYHTTQFVNSIGHTWGSRPFDTPDQSRNNALCALLTFGEGWHNNHHAFPASARHGLAPWQLDPTWMFIRLLVGLGIATRVSDASCRARKSGSGRHQRYGEGQ